MNKGAKRVIGIFIGLLLWGFFFIQKEFAFYGIYSLISYNVHELSSLIPMVCILATAIWIIVIIKKVFQKKACVSDKCFAVLLAILLLLQIGGFRAQGQDCTVTIGVTVESVYPETNIITAVNTQGNEATKIELYAQNFFIDMIEIDSKEYFATYICDRNNLTKGKLARLVLIQDE